MSTYQEKISKALKYIDENLSEDLNWSDVSKYCGISEYHFHRIFRGSMQETPREYIIRRRLERAISSMAYGSKNLDLAQLALHCGYSTQSNFNKAFKAYFGVTPSQVINRSISEISNIGKIKSRYGKDFKIKDLYSFNEINFDQRKGGSIMNVQIKEISAREVIYLSSKGGYRFEAIQETWAELMKAVSSLGNPMDDLSVFGIGHDNPQVTPEDKCRYDACILAEELKEMPKNFSKMTFPEGRYACFYYKGPNEELLDFYLKIYSTWFSSNGQEPGDFPLIERYISVDKENAKGDIELETQILLK